jgi:hypothetical protein
MNQIAESVSVIRALDQLGRQSSPSSLYQKRLTSNVQGGRRMSTQSGAWDGLLIGILTTQQRSTGRTNLVRQVINSGKLGWAKVSANPRVIDEQVQGFNHNRRKREYLGNAAIWLQDNWKVVKSYQRKILGVPVSKWKERYAVEQEASNFLADGISGIGPKQARNFWQHRGYAVWTIPLDSRIKAILAAEPFHLDIGGHYEDVEWEVIQLCRYAKTYPCLLDASLFNMEGLVRGYVGLPVD